MVFALLFRWVPCAFLQDRARSLYTTEKMGKVYAVAGSLSQRFFIAPKETAVQGDGRNGNNTAKKVAVIMGSDSDLPVVKPAIDKLKSFGVPVEAHVMSAHRTPALASEFAANAKANGFGVIIAAAGKAAHLGGVLAAHTTLPVIGIPIKSSTLDGLDALLATVQMPSGIPVATVAINGAENAAILAVQMLALSDEKLAAQLDEMKDKMNRAVIEKDAKLQQELAE